MSSLATNAITDASGGNTATINSYTPTESNMAGRNRIINGDMRIDQRNNGAAVTINAAAHTYTLDRWRFFGQASDGVFTVQQSTVAPAGFTNSALITVTTADASIGSAQVYVGSQAIEGFNVADLAWGTASASAVTLSFWVRSSLTGTFSGAVKNSDGTRSYPFTYSIASANTWEYKTVTIPGDTTGTWLTNNGSGIGLTFNLGSGSSRLGTANTWAAANLDGATGSTNLIGTSGATFYITGVQLEAGSVATPFERRQYGQELQLAQRYFDKSYDTDVAPGAAGFNGIIGRTGPQGANTAGEIFWNPRWTVTMRAAPTITLWDSSGNIGKVTRTAFGVADYTNSNFIIPSSNSKGAQINSAAGSSASNISFHYTASAEL